MFIRAIFARSAFVFAASVTRKWKICRYSGAEKKEREKTFQFVKRCAQQLALYKKSKLQIAVRVARYGVRFFRPYIRTS